MGTKTTVYKIVIDSDQAIKSMATLQETEEKVSRGFSDLKDRILGVKTPLNKITDAARKMRRKVGAAPRYIDRQFGRLQRRVDRFSFRRMQVNARRFERRMLAIPKRIQARFNKLNNKLGGFGGTLLAGIGIREGIRGAFSSLNASSDQSESANKAKTVFGDQFKLIEQFVRNSDEALGMSKAKALEATSSFGGLFKNIGRTQEEAAMMSKVMVHLSSDLASFHNLNPFDSMQALMSGMRGEMEPLASKFNIVLDEAAIKQKAFEMGLVSTTKGTLPKAIKSQAIYAAILEQTKDAQGDFVKTSGGFANMQRTISAGWKDVSAMLGQELMPVAIQFMGWIKSSIGWIKENKEQIKSWVKVGGTVALTLFSMWGAAKLFLGANAMILTIVKGWKLFKTVILSGRFALIAFNAVASISPFGWIALAIGAVVTLVRHWDTAKNYLVSIGKFLWKYHPMRWMINLIDKIFPGFKKALAKMFVWILDKFLVAYNWIKDKLKNWFNIEIGANVTGDEPKFGPGEDDKAEDDNPYTGMGKIHPPKFGSHPDQKTPTQQKQQELIQGAGNIKNINISIDSLVEQFSVVSNNINDAPEKVKAIMERVLLDTVNDVNYAQ